MSDYQIPIECEELGRLLKTAEARAEYVKALEAASGNLSMARHEIISLGAEEDNSVIAEIDLCLAAVEAAKAKGGER